MQRHVFVAFVALGLLAGCGPQPAPGPRQVAVPSDEGIKATPAALPAGPAAAPTPKTIDDILAGAAEPTAQDRYTASLMEALDLIARKKPAEALAALEAARQAAKDANRPAGDLDQIAREISRVKDGMVRRDAAETTVQNIRAVLDAGRADEASRLAADALAQYGGSDAADDLLKCKREADALGAAQADGAARKQRLRAEAQADLDAKNLRAAAAALEQALAQGADDDLKKQSDDVHDRLTRYDDNRWRAAELRRDPANLEDAVAALQEAQKAWDTFEIQQQIAEYQLALQNRRDRIGVADFEVRGDVGLADAGRTLADELLPAFKARFDLVERGQLGKVIDELKLETTDLDGGSNQAEVGRLAKLRYLVVGSVSRLGGVTVNARLVDVRSGLVVQTGRVSAPTPEDVLPLLPQLATVLMMTDEQKLAYERQLSQQAVALPPPAPVDSAPPPPPDVAPDQPPPAPLVTFAPAAPPPGDIRPEDFQALPAPPTPDQPPPVLIVERPDDPVKLRLRHVTIELGDNLFRRGRYHEAQVQFELALNAGCDRREVEIRLDRCRPYLPPPPPPEIIVVAPPPPPRPRLAILDLAVIGDPDAVPPVLGPWTADALAPYFCPNYEVVDRETVCWYMNRLGLSLRDVLTDPVARRWLGRALGVRFFVLGDIRQTASFVVTTHLVDAECGYDYGWGRVHVHDPFALKLALGDLAGQTQLDPVERKRRQEEAEAAEHERERLGQLAEAERLRALQESQNVPLLVLEAQKMGDGGDLSVSVELLGRARKLRPDDIEVNVMFNLFNDRRHRQKKEEEQKRQWEAQQAAIPAAQQQQLALALAVQQAQQQAAQAVAVMQAAQAQALEAQRQQAFLQLQLQAQAAVQQQQFAQAVQIYRTALALRQTDEMYRALADARARADEAARLAVAQAAAQQEAALRQQRDAELAAARQQLDAQRQQQEAQAQAALVAQAERDKAAYQRLLDDAQAQLAKDHYDAAISFLQTARQLRRTDEVDRLLNQALVDQARATAAKNNAAGPADLERQLADEKARREKAEAEAARNKDLYEQALKLAQQALADRKYDLAQAQYEQAGKVYQTDVVLTGLRKVHEARDADAAAAAAAQAKRDAEAKKETDFQRLADAGVAAAAAKQYDQAVQLLTDANALEPGDMRVLTALGKAEHDRADEAARARHDAEAAQQAAAFQQFLNGGKTNLAAKQYDAALVALKEAVRLKPDSQEAAAALQQAVKGQSDAALSASQQAEAKKKQDAYQKAMTDGRAALAAKQYDAAAAAFNQAQKTLPGDAASAEFLKQVQKVKADADAAAADATRKRDEEQRRVTAVQKDLTQARAALAGHDVATAGKALADAAGRAPNDPDVKRALQDLQTATAAAKAEADARQARAAQEQALVKKGADAQAAGRLDDAVQAFAEASRLAPDDATAKDLLAKAQKAKAEAQAAAQQAAAKKAADERAAQVGRMVADARKALATQDYAGAGKLLADARKLAPDDPAVGKAQDDLAKASKETADRLKKQQGDYALAMGAGKAAVRKGDYAGAANAYTEALRIQPGDKDAAAALQSAQQARATADANAAAAKKREADYAAAMKAGRDAMALKKWADAAKAFTDAARTQPGDRDAAVGLKAAQDAANAEANAKAAEGARQAQLARLLTQGQAALAGKKYDEAAKDFSDVLKLNPADPTAAKGLHDANAAVKAAQDAAAAEAAKKAAEAKRQADLANLMTQGQAALGARKYDDAAKAYSSALQLQPGDAKATAGLHAAQFGQHMTAGQALSAAKKYADAAKEFQAALAIMPDSPDAKAALKRAQNNMP